MKNIEYLERKKMLNISPTLFSGGITKTKRTYKASIFSPIKTKVHIHIEQVLKIKISPFVFPV